MIFFFFGKRVSRQIQKLDLLFYYLKIRAYLIFTMPVIGPSWLLSEHMDRAPAFLLSIPLTILVLHFVITYDDKGNHENLKMLIMRRRHFDAMINANKARGAGE